jgi:branched-subunit amino acid aminotransferase/4-amino-4-deoxychorismate lyase
VVLDGKIFTPLGTRFDWHTRSFAHRRRKGYPVIEQRIRAMLYITDEIFFTGTAAEISPKKR